MAPRFGVKERVRCMTGPSCRALAADEADRATAGDGWGMSGIGRGLPAAQLCEPRSRGSGRSDEPCGDAGFQVSLSSEILPEYREYERAATTVVKRLRIPTHADLYPVSGGRACLGRGCGCSSQMAAPFLPGRPRDKPCQDRALGPGGRAGGRRCNRPRCSGIDRFVSFDMGGTSTDVSLLRRSRGA